MCFVCGNPECTSVSWHVKKEKTQAKSTQTSNIDCGRIVVLKISILLLCSFLEVPWIPPSFVVDQQSEITTSFDMIRICCQNIAK